MNAIPGTTMHGNPVEKIEMGETEIPEEVFMEFIDNMHETYTADSYHLLGKDVLDPSICPASCHKRQSEVLTPTLSSPHFFLLKTTTATTSQAMCAISWWDVSQTTSRTCQPTFSTHLLDK